MLAALCLMESPRFPPLLQGRVIQGLEEAAGEPGAEPGPLARFWTDMYRVRGSGVV